jgi:hypothetical protein
MSELGGQNSMARCRAGCQRRLSREPRKRSAEAEDGEKRKATDSKKENGVTEEKSLLERRRSPHLRKERYWRLAPGCLRVLENSSKRRVTWPHPTKWKRSGYRTRETIYATPGLDRGSAIFSVEDFQCSAMPAARNYLADTAVSPKTG